MKKILLHAGLVLLFGATACQRNSGPASVSGTIETDEIHVASRYGGRVESLFAREGEFLTNGQLIAELVAPELRAARAQAAATLAEWEAGARAEEITAAKNDWEALLADLDMARLEKKRALELMRDKTISEAERDRIASRAAVLEKNVAAARSRYDLLLAGTRPERMAQARARLAEIDAQLGELRVVAPASCVLEVLSVKRGDVLAPNREVATLTLPDRLWVRVFVPEPWLGQVKLNETVRVRVDSFPGQDFEGRVAQINRAAEFTPRNVQTVDERIKQVFGIKVALPGHNDRLRAGMSADVFFPGVEKLVAKAP